MPNSPAASLPPNGFGLAALLSAGIGAFALALIAFAADRLPAFARALNFYSPSGPLSGVTTSAILIWLVAWALLNLRWRDHNLGPERIVTVAVILLILAVLLTFPPLADAL